MPGLVQSELAPAAADPEVTDPSRRPRPAAEEDALMAGYQDCVAEAVRYLVEEEGRAPDDPTVVGLTEHLQARSAYLEYLSLLCQLDTDMEDQLSTLLRSGREERQQELLSAEHRCLVETVFRGCDLVLQRDSPSPSPSPPPPAADDRRLNFPNNAYLDQVLSWAFTTEAIP
ncbi:uncharacterized protein LOC119101297 [Pollicipes pollicipes]|uniref:uncharacterized protein LOC119101297 n=1 Tax=Pollicipes pollicipes TaxID=41117 RepID=UPI00188523C6|nr:uncharacterized protein LOC119101297 [Pollicipes pollicipes]